MLEKEFNMENNKELLTRITEIIFKNLNEKHGNRDRIKFDKLIEKKADLSLIWPKLAVALLSDEKHGVLRLVVGEEYNEQRAAIENVITLYQKWIDHKVKPIAGAWEDAWAVAELAATKAMYNDMWDVEGIAPWSISAASQAAYYAAMKTSLESIRRTIIWSAMASAGSDTNNIDIKITSVIHFPWIQSRFFTLLTWV